MANPGANADVKIFPHFHPTGDHGYDPPTIFPLHARQQLPTEDSRFEQSAKYIYFSPQTCPTERIAMNGDCRCDADPEHKHSPCIESTQPTDSTPQPKGSTNASPAKAGLTAEKLRGSVPGMPTRQFLHQAEKFVRCLSDDATTQPHDDDNAGTPTHGTPHRPSQPPPSIVSDYIVKVECQKRGYPNLHVPQRTEAPRPQTSMLAPAQHESKPNKDPDKYEAHREASPRRENCV